MRKLIISILLTFVLVIGLTTVGSSVFAEDNKDGNSVFENIDYKKSSEIRVILDGEKLTFDVEPKIVEGRSLVPMRGIFEALGLDVEWDGINRIAKGTSSGTSISFTIGSDIVLVNDQEKTIDVAARIIDGRTMMPLRFVSENMGYNVVWVGNSNLILLSQDDIIEWRYDGYETTEPYKEYERKFINGEKTSKTRYTGINHEVEFMDLFSADGRIIPNVPEFNVAHYGTGWFFESPYAGKSYWIGIDRVTEITGRSSFYELDTYVSMQSSVVKESIATGNYVKVEIEEHFFDLNIWKKMGVRSNVELNAALSEKTLDGKIINSEDTIFKVTVNDEYSGYILLDDLLGPMLNPEKGDIYTVLDKNPRAKFKWSDDTWQRLKGDNPWTGMTKDMILVQKQKTADKSTRLKTRFSVFELWVYEQEYLDLVYMFDNGVLKSMW